MLSIFAKGIVPLATPLAASAIVMLHVSSVAAETLQHAIKTAYQFNPTLDAARARLRGIDETVTQARGEYRPVIGALGELRARKDRIRAGGANTNATSRGRSATLFATQTIFRGFRTINEIRQAEATVRAGREGLAAAEQAVFLEVATAYANVFHGREIVKYRRSAVRAANARVSIMRKRFKEEDVTKTDLEQTKANKLEDEENLIEAVAFVRRNEADFERVVGRKPGRLVKPWIPHHLIPKSRSSLVAIAIKDNPIVMQSLYFEQGGRLAVDVIRGELLPTLVATGALETSRVDALSSRVARESAAVSLNLVVPIYQGGIVSSEVRQAKQNHIALIQDVKTSRDRVRAVAQASWAQLRSSKKFLRTVRRRLQILRRVTSGVTSEEQIGQRTVLDVLTANDDFTDALVDMARAKRERVVSAFITLGSAGRLTASRLAVSDIVYDPKVHYSEVRRKAWGTTIARDEVPEIGNRQTIGAWQTSVKQR